ncbi:putative ribonuclease H domain, reverse transcriptase zinc-binding domain-containing protein [Arabidopsis thaliana]|uniref:Ribonuclease H domain n=1 Tax=Arabidopsis thaliana x Arabidopsis arenosa TaxID=1240361 RepID=A0A8T2E4F7_9BRAS|nr:Ribonuclease H domain [Arabidopsis thaliana x Arabidopsis arenosa]
MALPTYTMACFLLPKTVCKQIISVLADFWWRNKQEAKGMHWKAWDHLSRPKAEGGIGFKDIEAFNLALLGKQMWRMLSRPESLMAKVFKSRYFHKSDPLNAPLGSRPSFVWKSIHASQEILRQGARAVVGNGEDIIIWRHKWLDSKPASAALRMQRVPPQEYASVSSILKVSDLIDESGREWRKDVIEMLFPEVERKLIGELRPGGRRILDSYTWDYTSSGDYTVKSGYWVLTQIINKRSSPQEVSEPSLNPIYQKIWKSQTSPKIQHFLWKCLSNSLPVAGALAYRHLSKESACIRCPSCKETVNHLLFKCTFARLTWAISSIPIPLGGEWADSIYVNLYWVFNLGNGNPQWEKASQLVPWLLWRLWKNRNELVFRGREFNAQEVLRRAEDDLEEWRIRTEAESCGTKLQVNKSSCGRWRPPPHQWVKCNTDATWNRDNERCGIGWVLRNEKGEVKWMGARALPKLKSVLEAELEAMRWAVLSLSRFQYNYVIFESDSQVLIEILNNDEIWPSLKPAIQDLQRLLSQFTEVKFVFIPREGNTLAERVARESLSFLNYDPKLYSIVPSWARSSMD